LTTLIDQDDRPKHTSVNVFATLGRHVQSEGETLGYIQKLKSFGMQFINDTCWCMLMDPPIIPSRPDAKIITNSGKYAHYGPGLTNRKVRFGSMHQCIEVAKSGTMNSGRSSNNGPRWLRSISTQSIVRFMKIVK
jgi:predicted aconitase